MHMRIHHHHSLVCVTVLMFTLVVVSYIYGMICIPAIYECIHGINDIQRVWWITKGLLCLLALGLQHILPSLWGLISNSNTIHKTQLFIITSTNGRLARVDESLLFLLCRRSRLLLVAIISIVQQNEGWTGMLSIGRWHGCGSLSCRSEISTFEAAKSNRTREISPRIVNGRADGWAAAIDHYHWRHGTKLMSTCRLIGGLQFLRRRETAQAGDGAGGG
jgi:hypothetical protein